MKEKIIYYFYNLGLKGWENYLVLLACVITSIIVVYTVAKLLVKKFSDSKMELFNKIALYVYLLLFIGFAFLLNIIINDTIEFRDGIVDDNPYLFMSNINFYRICDYDYIRGLIELITFIPIGLCLYKIINKKKMIKLLTYPTVMSLVFELLVGNGHISRYYWQTLLNNILGALVGVGIVILLNDITKKSDIDKKKLLISQVPVCIVLVTYGIMYILYFTNMFRSVYPDYYEKIDSNRLNVTYMCDKPIEYQIQYFRGLFTEEEFGLFTEKMFNMYETKVDESKTLIYETDSHDGINGGPFFERKTNDKENIFCYLDTDSSSIDFRVEISEEQEMEYENLVYTEKQVEKFFKKCDIKVPRKTTLHVKGNKAHFYQWYEIADGVYSNTNISASFDDKGRPYKLSISSSISWEITKNSDFLDLDTVLLRENSLSPEEAYENLCAGECYAEGLVEATQNGKVDVVVNNVRMVLHTDNLNCRQYVYCFDVEPIEVEGQTPITKIYVPAMNNNKLLRNRFSEYVHEH